MQNTLKQQFDFIFEDTLLLEIETVGSLQNIQQGNILIDIGQPITHMPLLLNGAVKILREDKQGNELLLYFIERGDTCAMTLSCCFGKSKSKIRAVAETNVQLLMIPIEKMELWMENYQSWRKFILESYHNRMMELIDAVDTIAFLKMDDRILKHLQDKAKVLKNNVLEVTHQKIAEDMHTSRVVVSRILKKLEKEGKIQMYRNAVKVVQF
jgi:CRP/FNR family transcriptional regulator